MQRIRDVSPSGKPEGLRERVKDKFEDVSLRKEVHPYLIVQEDILHLQAPTLIQLDVPFSTSVDVVS